MDDILQVSRVMSYKPNEAEARFGEEASYPGLGDLGICGLYSHWKIGNIYEPVY
jgi:hypothetical protein